MWRLDGELRTLNISANSRNADKVRAGNGRAVLCARPTPVRIAFGAHTHRARRGRWRLPRMLQSVIREPTRVALLQFISPPFSVHEEQRWGILPPPVPILKALNRIG